MKHYDQLRRLALGVLAGALGISAGWAMPPAPVFPPKPDPTNRYLVDGNNVLFLMVDDDDGMLVLTVH